MIKNPLARPFFEFLSAHDLSLYRVAKLARISEGTLRSYRDVEGRRLTKNTMYPVAEVLCHLTKQPIDILYIFGDGSQRSDEDNSIVIRPHANAKFSDLLWERQILEEDLARIAGIDEEFVSALLGGEAIPRNAADRITAALGVASEEIGISETLDDDVAYYNAKNIKAALMPHSKDKYVNIMHTVLWSNIDLDPDFPSAGIEIFDHLGEFAPRPPSLIGNDGAFGIDVCFQEMAPRMEVGERLFINPDDFPHPGSDVLIEFKQTERRTESIAIVRRLCDYNENSVLLRKYNPSEYEEIPKERIKKIYKILKTRELF